MNYQDRLLLGKWAGLHLEIARAKARVSGADYDVANLTKTSTWVALRDWYQGLSPTARSTMRGVMRRQLTGFRILSERAAAAGEKISDADIAAMSFDVSDVEQVS